MSLEIGQKAEVYVSARHTQLRAELAGLIDPITALSARVTARLTLVSALDTGDDQRERWILVAYKGTLDKLSTQIADGRPHSDVELIAVARGVFENLIWLKLFALNSGYGLRFYGDLLDSQIQSQQQAITKATAEIELFTQLSTEEDERLDAATADLNIDSDVERFLTRYHDDEKEIDDRARRTFSLYAAQAKTNGYSYQAEIIRSKVVPAHEERIQTLTAHKNALALVIAQQPAAFRPRLTERWNWKAQAMRTEMELQYNFLYSYTSRLLHATPMSLATPQKLDDSEIEILLDYVCIAVADCLTEIDGRLPAGDLRVVVL